MLTTILGIPAHPLLIHAAVVLVPLLVAAAIVYALWRAARSRLDWAVAGLAVVTPFAVLFSKLSGQNFRTRLIERKFASPQILAKITTHQSYGNKTFWWTIGFAVLALVLLWYDRRVRRGSLRDVTWLILTIATVVVGAVLGYYVFKTGDTGAHIVWSGF